MTRKRLYLLAAPLLLAAGAWVGTTHTVAFAYNTPQCSISEISGSSSTTAGGTDTFTFHVLDLHGNAFPNQTLFFSNSGTAAGSVNPLSGTTNGSGDAFTVFTASASDSPGQVATITANDPAEGCAGSAATTIAASGAGGVQAISTGTLPNTSTGAPGSNGLLYLGLGLALMVILGGAVTLRRSRAAAS